jgi:transcriptional regulator with XRE-family HTH domain
MEKFNCVLLGKRLRRLRKIRGFTAARLAEIMGVSVGRVLSIETSGRDMQVGTVYSYVSSLGLELFDVFLYWDNSEC